MRSIFRGGAIPKRENKPLPEICSAPLRKLSTLPQGEGGLVRKSKLNSLYARIQFSGTPTHAQRSLSCAERLGAGRGSSTKHPPAMPVASGRKPKLSSAASCRSARRSGGCNHWGRPSRRRSACRFSQRPCRPENKPTIRMRFPCGACSLCSADRVQHRLAFRRDRAVAAAAARGARHRRYSKKPSFTARES